jgi:hypothetical protein
VTNQQVSAYQDVDTGGKVKAVSQVCILYAVQCASDAQACEHFCLPSNHQLLDVCVF